MRHVRLPDRNEWTPNWDQIEPDPRGVSLHYLGDATIGQPGALNPLSLGDWSENRSCNRSGMVPNSAESSILPGGGVALLRDLADIGTLDTRLCAHQGDACQHWSAGIIVGYLAGLRLWLAHYRDPAER